MKNARICAGVLACGLAVAGSASAVTLPNIRSAVPCFFGALGSPSTCRPTQAGALGPGAAGPSAQFGTPRAPSAAQRPLGFPPAGPAAGPGDVFPTGDTGTDTVSTVPIPGSWLALASGVVLLGGLRKRAKG